VDSPLSPFGQRELEVFDGVGDVDQIAIDAGGHQRPVEQLARRADERPSRSVLLIAGLFADHHHPRVAAALAENRLCRIEIQVAALAPLRGIGEHRGIAGVGRDEVRGAGCCGGHVGVLPAARPPHASVTASIW
jgi:hypothetical protein